MSVIKRRYYVHGWKPNSIYYLTAKELYSRILEDSKSDYDWIASATELVNVCNTPNFPEEYAQGIKICILNCFANLELERNIGSHGELTDDEAVYFCYNSLIDSNKNVIDAKSRYLKAIINSIIVYFRFGSHIHSFNTYKEISQKWAIEKFDEYFPKEAIDFEKFRKDLYADFDNVVTTAEEEGSFKKEEEQYLENSRRFMSSLMAKLTPEDFFFK